MMDETMITTTEPGVVAKLTHRLTVKTVDGPCDVPSSEHVAAVDRVVVTLVDTHDGGLHLTLTLASLDDSKCGYRISDGFPAHRVWLDRLLVFAERYNALESTWDPNGTYTHLHDLRLDVATACQHAWDDDFDEVEL